MNRYSHAMTCLMAYHNKKRTEAICIVLQASSGTPMSEGNAVGFLKRIRNRNSKRYVESTPSSDYGQSGAKVKDINQNLNYQEPMENKIHDVKSGEEKVKPRVTVWF